MSPSLKYVTGFLFNFFISATACHVDDTFVIIKNSWYLEEVNLLNRGHPFLIIKKDYRTRMHVRVKHQSKSLI
jgi:hypothetical protein